MSVGLIDVAIKADGMKPTDKLILILIANCSNDHTKLCVPSQRYLAERSGLTRESVNRICQRLVEDGHLAITPQFHDKGGKRANSYIVLGKGGGGYVTQDHIGGDVGSHTHVTQDHMKETEYINGNTKRVGTRLPDDWKLPKEWAQWAKEERPDLHLKTVADTFKDYWISVAGSRGTKRDWFAVWRNWIRREPKIGERKMNGSAPVWATLPMDDQKLDNFARSHQLPAAKVGETFGAYRVRLQSAVQDKLRQ